MSDYTDIQLINCNKSASIEERTKDTANKPEGIFTNQLNQSLILEEGDVLNIEHAFVNEVGAGSEQPIEFLGEKIPVKNTTAKPLFEVEYTDYVGSDEITDKTDDAYRMGLFTKYVATRTRKNYELQDNIAYMSIGYYFNTSDHPEYITQPRRWVQKTYFDGICGMGTDASSPTAIPLAFTDPLDPSVNWDTTPDASTGLMANEYINTQNYCKADWTQLRGTATTTFFRQKLSNQRYTAYVNTLTYYDGVNHSNIPPAAFRKDIWAITQFLRYRELKTIQVKAGFNTPSSIADQITQTLNEEDDPVPFTVLDNKWSGLDRYEHIVTTTISNSTFKPINCANYHDCQEYFYLQYKTDDWDDGLDINKWYSSMTQFIGIKRPEIMDSARYISNGVDQNGDAIITGIPLQPSISNYTNGVELGYVGQTNGYDGIALYNDIMSDNGTASPARNNTSPIILQMEYTEENLLALKNFFESQALYPELWDNLTELPDYLPSVGFDKTKLQPNNSRFIHMNAFQNTTTLRPVDAGGGIVFPIQAYQNDFLGNDNFEETDAYKELNSRAVFFYYDEDQKDTYYEPHNVDYNKNKPFNTLYTYGFAQAVLTRNPDTYPWYSNTPRVFTTVPPLYGDIYLIAIRPDLIGGLPASLFTEDTPVNLVNDGASVPVGTKCIRTGRRCGYDYHSTAFSTCILSPYSGVATTSYVWSTVNNSTPPSTVENADKVPPTEHGVPADNDQKLIISLNALPNINNTEARIKTGADPAESPSVISNLDSLAPYMTQLYMGANKPQLIYDSDKNRFSFNQFHTANNIGNTNWLDGNANQTKLKINTNQSDVCYKINPQITEEGFSPEFMPYNGYKTCGMPFPNSAQQMLEGKTNVYKDEEVHENEIQVQQPNFALEKNEIFDSHGGIYVDDWGFDENNWQGCLWEVMGFSYEQLNAEPTSGNTLLNRFTNKNNDSMYRMTTNADIVSTDTKSWVMNPYEAGFFTNQIHYPPNLINWKPLNVGNTSIMYFNMSDPPPTSGSDPYPSPTKPDVPIIQEVTTSLNITSEGLCKSMLKPYYSIHSSLISEPNSIGGERFSVATQLPIMGICNKFSAEGDYFFTESNLNFTMTKKMVMSSIVTEIRNPDGTYANVDRGCGVIYKVTRNKQLPQDIIGQILKSLKDK